MTAVEKGVISMERSMRYAYEIYKTKSFSKAAENLYISQPALSAIIRKLEENLGTPLFDRSVKPVICTPAGLYYIYCAEQIMNIEEGMAQYFEDISSLKKGTIRIGASSYFCSSVLPDLLRSFHEEYPYIDFQLSESNSTPFLREQLLSREIDFAISSNTYPSAEYDRIVLEQESIILAVPSSSPVNQKAADYSYSYDEMTQLLDSGSLKDASGRFAPLDLFKDEKFITIDRNSDLVPRIISMFKAHGAVPEFIMHLEQMSSCYYMAASQFGSTFLRSSTLHTVKDTGNLCLYLIDSPLANREAYLYYKKGGYLSRSMEAFISWITKEKLL